MKNYIWTLPFLCTKINLPFNSMVHEVLEVPLLVGLWFLYPETGKFSTQVSCYSDLLLVAWPTVNACELSSQGDWLVKSTKLVEISFLSLFCVKNNGRYKSWATPLIAKYFLLTELRKVVMQKTSWKCSCRLSQSLPLIIINICPKLGGKDHHLTFW